MKRNFRIIIEYDGTNCHGWQVQAKERTVQGELQRALEIMTGQPVVVHGSGRTDAGVHALAQVASFECDTRIPAQAFQKGLNSLLDEDIVIHACEEVPADFHARFSAQGKTYNYRIINQPLRPVIGRQYAWYIRKPLDIEAMQKAADYLYGEHDFKAFEGIGSPRAHTVRHITLADFEKGDDGLLVFRIQANGFLRYMVRNIVGTLAEVGIGKLTPEAFRAILESKDRAQAGATAPPQGLFLMHVNYGESPA